MPRELILLPPDPRVITGAVPIGPGYTKQHTPDELRGYAADLDTLYRVTEEDRALPPDQRRLNLWRSVDPDQLPDEARRVLRVHKKLYGDDHLERIEGDLKDDGRVEIAVGRHRTHYVIERGDTPVPVWVAHPEQARLDELRERSEAEVTRMRTDLRARQHTAERDRALGRVAIQGRDEALTRGVGRVALEGADRQPPPEYHVPYEKMEQTRERGVFRGERDG